MSHAFIVASALLASLIFTSVDGRAATCDLYLLLGQSNMDGRGQASDLTPDQIRPLKSVDIYYRNPTHCSDGWKPLAPGFSVPPKFRGELPSPTFGPEIGFAGELLRVDPSRKIVLIKGSKGGTSLRKDWDPGEKGNPATQGKCYRSFCETYRMATDELKKSGIDFQVRGLLWHQGESDSKSNTDLYKKRFHRLVDRIQSEIGVEDFPVVVGEVFDNGKRDKVRAALQSIGTSGSRFGLVSAAGTSTSDVGTHFDSASQLLLGQRYAKAILKIQAGTKTVPTQN